MGNDPRVPLGHRQIRLLKLHPGSRDEEIRCSILVASLDDCPAYEALSYTWGSPSEGGGPKIRLSGSEHNVSENLYAALKRLRYPRDSVDTEIPEDNGAFIDVNNRGDSVELKKLSAVLHENKGRSRYLWADAVCIKQDQDDHAEKPQQVGLMGDIYQRCSRGVIWLGEAASLTERAFMAAYWLCKLSYHQDRLRSGRKGSDKGQDSREGSQSRPSFLTMLRLDDVKVKWTMCQCWKELMALVSRQWFTRAWVVQEATLSRDVRLVCGGYSIPWSELCRALYFVPAIPIRPLAGVRVPSHIHVIEKLRQELAKGRPSLLSILLRNNNCDATVLVDRIYAFCGLIDETERQRLGLTSDDINYGEVGKSEETYRDLCRKLAIKLLKTSASLDLLSGPVGNPEGRSSWPSWIPDWAAPRRPACLLLDQPFFDASKSSGSAQTFEIRDQDYALGADGFEFDSIEEVSQVADRGPPDTWTFLDYEQYKKRMEGMVEFHQRCLEWEATANARSKEAYIGGGGKLDAYWQTLLGGHVTPDNFESQRQQFQRFDMISKDGARFLQRWGLPAWPWILFLTPHNLAVLFTRAMVTKRDYLGLLRIGDFTSNPNHDFVRKRRVIRTAKGYMGLAPASAQRGDAVALLSGARVPLVVRKTSNSPEMWCLVGECYVHGIMSGEAWDGKECKRMWFA